MITHMFQRSRQGPRGTAATSSNIAIIVVVVELLVIGKRDVQFKEEINTRSVPQVEHVHPSSPRSRTVIYVRRAAGARWACPSKDMGGSPRR